MGMGIYIMMDTSTYSQYKHKGKIMWYHLGYFAKTFQRKKAMKDEPLYA